MSQTYSKGLEGVIAGETALATVGKKGHGLMYRGYSIHDLADNCIFEEVAWLLLRGALPTQVQLNQYRQKLESYRHLPLPVRTTLEQIPKDAHPMDVLKVGVGILGTVRPEAEDFSNMLDVADMLIASYGSMLLYHYHYHRGKQIDTRGERGDTIAKHFLRLLHQKEPAEDAVKLFDCSLILYAEHGYAASTFCTRVTISTLSDMYSAIGAAIGTLRGPLHGGANEKAMYLCEQFSSPEEAVRGVRELLAKKTKIMGFGHRVYKKSDPRSDIIKRYSKEMSQKPGGKPVLFAVQEAIDKLMWSEKKLFTNADFYMASAYNQCGIPTNLFTPIFVIARTAGWCSHVIEQRANNRLIRPSGLYVGPSLRKFVSMDKRPHIKAKL